MAMTYPIAADYDDPDCNTGMSLAYAVVKKIVAQALFHLTDLDNTREDVAGDIAYKIALAHRHERSIPAIAAIAVAAALTHAAALSGVDAPASQN